MLLPDINVLVERMYIFKEDHNCISDFDVDL